MNEIYEGPKVFIHRLQKHLVIGSKVFISNPSNADVRIAKKLEKDRVLIARLDGLAYNDFSYTSLRSYLLANEKFLAAKLVPTCYKFPRFLNKLLNDRINRNSKWLVQNSMGIVFQSELSLKMHLEFGNYSLNNKKYAIINNGVDLSEFSGQSQTRLSGYPALIISASTFRLHKRLQEAILLTNLLRQKYPSINLHILGNLDFLTKEVVAKLDLSSCIFHGRVPQGKLASFYGGADIQLSLSIWDPCPNVVCEGLACGLPVITPYESGASELVGNTNQEWVVKEKLNFDYTNLYSHFHLPAFPLNKYVEAVENVLCSLEQHSLRARYRAVSSLDINLIAKQYSKFIGDVTNEY